MEKTARRVAVLGVVALAAVLGMALLPRQGHRAAADDPLPWTPAPITIDSDIGETFTPAPPPPPFINTQLTADEAWAKFAISTSDDPDYSPPPIPSRVTVQLGYLTGVYDYVDKIVWGYSWHECPLIIGGPGMALTVPADDPCIHWLFLGANRGEQADETWQH
jgi:hypothetical protein